METLTGVLTALGGATAVLILVFCALWKVIAPAITARITKQVSRELEREASSFQHVLSKDMERYKDELSRAQSVDRMQMELRKSVAENLLEMRIHALHELARVNFQFPSFICGVVTSPKSSRPSFEVVEKEHADFETHVTMAASTFDGDFRLRVLHLDGLCIKLFDRYSDEPLSKDDPLVKETTKAFLDLDGSISAKLLALPDELAKMLTATDSTLSTQKS
ncbi:hypothetical protein QFZ99_006077 [Paraburkholderia atlantica]|uniref:hypothetical protein n=1 Tax=Paraburkholderia atlantica TaxID=2654982 RepID=UPI003D24B115